jgi:hypothetical protein
MSTADSGAPAVPRPSLRWRAASLVAVGLGLLPGPGASAAEVTWTFTGTIVDTWGMVGAFPASAFAGAPITGSLRFDPAVADGDPGDPENGSYPQPIPPHAFEVQIGGAEFVPPTGFFLGIGDDSTFLSGADSLSVTAAVAFPYPGVPDVRVSYLSIFLVDASGTVFASDALPAAPPPLAGFPPGSRDFGLNGCASAHFSATSCATLDFTLGGELDSLTLPEPAAGGTAVAAACLLALAGRRRAAPSRPPAREGDGAIRRRPLPHRPLPAARAEPPAGRGPRGSAGGWARPR